MITELKNLEPQLKQILYGCVEHIQATKAAVYLPASYDLTDKKFEMITSYQFSDASRRVVTSNDEVVDTLAVKRAPFFVNGLGTEQKFAEMLFRQSTDRFLAAPLMARGRIIGFLDLRDKAGRKPFERDDLAASMKIAEDILAALGEKSLFGLEPARANDEMPVTDLQQELQNARLPIRSLVPPAPASPPPPSIVRPATLERPMPSPLERQPTPSDATPVSRNALRIISAAREQVSRPVTKAPRLRNAERDLDVFRLVLPAALGIPGAVMACLTVVDAQKVTHALVATGNLGNDTIDLMMNHVQRLLRRSPQSIARPQVSYPYGFAIAPITSASISTIQSAPLDARALDGIAISIGFQNTADAVAASSMQTFMQQMEPAIWGAALATAELVDRETAAEKLIEPDFQKYPDLVDHSRQVAALVHRFATALDMPRLQAENVRLAALVHDVGLRLLDYEDLYRNTNLTQEQARVIAEHPIVGAAVVGPLLGPDIAQTVLRHHERVDGKGYPSRLTGNQIPIMSRIIQVADAWIAMTSASSYQPSVLVEQAAARLREGAGTQFDEQLVNRFIAFIPQLVASP